MMSITLHIILTRNVTVGDLMRVATALNKPLLQRVEGGLDLAHGGEGEFRDLRFQHCGKCRSVDSYTNPDAIFLDAKPGVTQWLPTGLRFKARSAAAAPFALDEALPIMDAVCAQFDARPALVKNRRELKIGSPLPTSADTTQTVNDFYGYDVAEAIETFSVERVEYPGIVNERLFVCWRCQNMYPAGSFKPLGYDDNIDQFYWVLGNHVAGNVTACCVCSTELTVRPAVPPTETLKATYKADAAATRKKRKSTVYTVVDEHGNRTIVDKMHR